LSMANDNHFTRIINAAVADIRLVLVMSRLLPHITYTYL